MFNNKYLSLAIIVLITFLASAIGGVVTSLYKEPWYSQIIQPSFSPPSWIFGPVWTTLYILMSIAIWFNWLIQKDYKTIKIYFVHIFFNGIWSIIFFGFHQILLAFLNLLIILFFILWLMMIYYKNTKLSFLLMIPYLLWSTYALLLNGSILYLN
ncbi:MAG: TspO protein [Candidatus Pelagibacter sp.]|nr:TspO protein [Candidatus Pelagibacter sp.]|tara:strand:+ start:4670 stop:5134 length:465 start_codon:yes stop_codon:yes gene_type:complete